MFALGRVSAWHSLGEAMPRYDRRQDIEGLRGIAVIAVLLFHAGFSRFSGGFVGVDVFFVISGFVITGLLCREIERTGTVDFSRFVAGRIRRLLPAYALTIVGALIAGFLLFAPAHFYDLSASAMYAAAAIPNFYFWQQSGYFDISSGFRPLLHTWSLGVEQQFYLAWPVVLVVAAKLPSRFAAPSVVVAAGLASIWLNAMFDQNAAAIFYLPWFRVFEFAIGSCVYWLGSVRRKGVAAQAVGTVGLALILGAVFGFDETVVFPSWNALVPCFGTALIIYAGSRSWVGRIAAHRAIAAIGTLSYSIYLVHWPLLVFWRYAKFDELTNLDRCLAIAVTFAIAWPMYRYVEMPIHQGAWSRRLPAASVGLIGATALALIALAAYLPWSHGGWQFRAGDAVRNYPELAAIGEVEFRRSRYGGAATTPDFHTGIQPPSILIAGDSHARQYFAGLADLYPPAESGFRVIDQGSCIFRIERCADFDAVVREFIAQNADGLLFVSQRWDFDKHIGLHFGRAAVGHTSPSTLATFYADRIAAMFEIYALPPRQTIFIMGAIPEVTTLGDVATCLLRPVFFSAAMNCEASREQDPAIAFRRQFNKLLSDHIGRLNLAHGWNIEFGDPFDILCKSGVCDQISGGQILYHDNDHLSIDGSKRVIAAFSDRLQAVFPVEAAGKSAHAAAPLAR